VAFEFRKAKSDRAIMVATDLTIKISKMCAGKKFVSRNIATNESIATR
jgi:hypothetical protein